MVFVLGFPRETFATAMGIEALFAVGGSPISPMRWPRPSSPMRAHGGSSPANRSANSRSICGPSPPIFDPKRIWRRPMARRSGSRRHLSEQLQSARALLLDHARRALGELPPRRHDRHSARRFRRAHRRAVRRRDHPRDLQAAALLERVRAALRVGALDLDHLSLELLTTEPTDAAARPPAGDRRPQARGRDRSTASRASTHRARAGARGDHPPARRWR